MSIHVVTGKPGQGKSLFLAWLMSKETRRPCLANVHCKGDLWEFALWRDMILAEGALCCIDEGASWFNSRSWQKNTNELVVFQQHRKFAKDVYIVSQHENRLDGAITELAETYIRCKKVGPVIIAKHYDPSELDKPIGADMFFWRAYCGYYFTEEIIGDRDGTGYSMGLPYAERKSRRRSALRPNHYRVECPDFVKYFKIADDGYLDDQLADTIAMARISFLCHGLPAKSERVLFPVYVDAGGRTWECHGNQLDRQTALVTDSLWRQSLKLLNDFAQKYREFDPNQDLSLVGGR